MVTIPRQPAGGPVPTFTETELARESSRQLAAVRGEADGISLRVQPDGEPEVTVAVPPAAFRLFKDILAEMAAGNAVALLPVRAELTTQQAADLLHVSRPFLIDLLETGVIPHRKVGTHRRVLTQHVLEYKQRTDAARLAALDELSALDQQSNAGY